MSDATAITTTTTPDLVVDGERLLQFHPAVDRTREQIALPVTQVTLLEDRARVERHGEVTLPPGRHRLSVWQVSPILQDVSLRVASLTPGVRVDDARVRRARRIAHKDRPEQAASLERALDDVADRYRELLDEAARLQRRQDVVRSMMAASLHEIPEDAAWSLGDVDTWKKTFETLSTSAHALVGERHGLRGEAEDVYAEATTLLARRTQLDRPDVDTLAILEFDVVVDGDAGAAPVVAALSASYTVANALWRPTHEATLSAQTLDMLSQAAVWQHTGEDWNDVTLHFSTAQSSLGHEPPLLDDDRLQVQKKDQRVVVAAREVAIQRAGAGRADAPPVAGVELPGVDDGGDVQLIKASAPTTVPSDGRPCFVPLFQTSASVARRLVVVPELSPHAHVRAEAPHAGDRPLLAGPVALIRDSGPVGYTTSLFVAPGERVVLGFGPDDDVRVQRTLESSDKVDEIDLWRRRTVTVNIYLSNLGGDEKQLEIIERIPVSEVEHVRVTLEGDKTSGAPNVDDDGLVKWEMSLPARGRLRLNLVYTVATAPGVAMG